MNRSERIKIMVNIRKSIHDLVKDIFDTIDQEIESNTAILENEKIVKASKVRFALKHLRQEKLMAISNIGKEYEPELEDL